MPLYVRQLPCRTGDVIEKGSLPKHTVMMNPSIAYPILYIRTMTMNDLGEMNSITLHNMTTKETTLVNNPSTLAPSVNFYQGMEDLRLVWYKERIWFTATSTHASMRMTNELLVGMFSEDLTSIERMSVVDIGVLPVKNICPFVHEDKLKLLDVCKQCIYTVEEVCVDEEWVGYKVRATQPLKCGASLSIKDLRGSSTPIRLFGDTWGCVVHDIIYNDNAKMLTKLSYLHHWMEFDMTTGTVTFLSSPFWIAHWGVEFVSGLHYDEKTDEITLYLGVDDRMPKYAKTTIGDLRIGK